MYWSVSSRVVMHSLSTLSGRSRVTSASFPNLQFLGRFTSKSSLLGKVDGPQSEAEQSLSFTVSYLIESCGLSSEKAKSVSKKVLLKTPENRDSILCLLRDHGFTNVHIAKVITCYRHLLLRDSEKSIMPRLQFLLSVGVSRPELGKIISSNPSLVFCSLNNKIIPHYNFLKNELRLNDKKIILYMKKMFFFLSERKKERLIQNVSILRGLGMPQSSISTLISTYPAIVTLNAVDFDRCLQRVVKLGFNPLTTGFVNALAACGLKTSTWEHKVNVYRTWGWSEDDVTSAFRKQPICMLLSESKIMDSMNFLVGKMGMKSSVIAENPLILFFSLKKRIIPRCSVVKVLQLKGLVKADISISSVLSLSENCFMDKFVTKYVDDVPQLLKIFGGKMDLEDLGFGNTQLCW